MVRNAHNIASCASDEFIYFNSLFYREYVGGSEVEKAGSTTLKAS